MVPKYLKLGMTGCRTPKPLRLRTTVEKSQIMIGWVLQPFKQQ